MDGISKQLIADKLGYIPNLREIGYITDKNKLIVAKKFPDEVHLKMKGNKLIIKGYHGISMEISGEVKRLKYTSKKTGRGYSEIEMRIILKNDDILYIKHDIEGYREFKKKINN